MTTDDTPHGNTNGNIEDSSPEFYDSPIDSPEASGSKGGGGTDPYSASSADTPIWGDDYDSDGWDSDWATYPDYGYGSAYSYSDYSMPSFSFPERLWRAFVHLLSGFATIAAVSLSIILISIGMLIYINDSSSLENTALFAFLAGILVLLWSRVSYLRNVYDNNSWVWYSFTPFAKAVLGSVLILASLVLVTNVLAFLLIVIAASLFPISYYAYSTLGRSRLNPARFSDPESVFNNETLALDFVLMSVSASSSPTTFRRLYERAFNNYQKYHSVREFLVYILLNILLACFGVTLLFLSPPASHPIFDQELLSGLQFGFLGSYLFSVQLIYRRYTTRDLQPAVYLFTALNMIGGIIFNFVAFAAIGGLVSPSGEGDVTTLSNGITAILAFALGYFPYLAIRWFGRIAHGTLEESRQRTNQLPLDTIGGMSSFHETRLRDLGIDNVQNLATTDLFDVLTRTNFRAQLLMDWVDQAILYMHLDEALVQVFRSSKIRTATDLLDRFKTLNDEDESKRDGELDKMATQLGMSKDQLIQLEQVVSNAPNIYKALTYWTNKEHETAIVERAIEVIERLHAPTLALNNLNGISASHLQRLNELRIEDIHKLAATHLPQLIADTRNTIPEAALINWVDQALLYAQIYPEQIRIFRTNNIDSATTLVAAMATPGPVTLSRNLSMRVEQLNDLLQTLTAHPNYQFIKAYREKEEQEQTTNQDSSSQPVTGETVTS